MEELSIEVQGLPCDAPASRAMTLALVPYHKPYERVIHEGQGLLCDVPASRAMTLALVPYHKPYGQELSMRARDCHVMSLLAEP